MIKLIDVPEQRNYKLLIIYTYIPSKNQENL